MNIPGVKMIKALYYANKPLKKVAYKENIIIQNELDGYYEQVINNMYGKIDAYARRADLNVRLAQEGDLLLINSGNKTSFIDKKEIKRADDIYKAIVDSIDKTMSNILASHQ